MLQKDRYQYGEEGNGPVFQSPLSATELANLAGPIPGNGSVSTGIIDCAGYKGIAFGCQTSQTGQITIKRFLDAGGLLQVGASTTAALAGGGAAAVAQVNDGAVWKYAQITISNTNASASTVSNPTGLLQSL